MTEKPQAKNGCDLVVGDVMIGGDDTCRTITGFDDHPGFKGHAARVAKSGDYGITVFDDDFFRLCGNGGYIPAHLWWHHEKK